MKQVRKLLLKSPTSGVDRPRVSFGFNTRNVLMPEGRPLMIPTGRSDCGGGDTVGGTVGAWRPRAPVPQTVIIDKERWFSSHTSNTRRKKPNS